MFGNKVNDGKVIKINKPLLEETIELIQKISDIKRNYDYDQAAKDIQKQRDFAAVVNGGDKDDIDIMRLKKEREKLEELKKIKEMSNKEKSDINEYEQKLNEKLRREEIFQNHKRQMELLNIRNDIERRRMFEELFDRLEKEILDGQRSENLKGERLKRWEDFQDWKSSKMDRM